MCNTVAITTAHSGLRSDEHWPSLSAVAALRRLKLHDIIFACPVLGQIKFNFKVSTRRM